ncbi:MAG: protein TolR [Alphaproteobacteria bacterium]|nr:protein TolR [Alphaproteobacteria bacterium]
MATSLVGHSVRGGRRRRGPGRFTDINVTPLVDVMLVLLIVFMVTAPLLTVGVPVDLPKTQAATINERDEPLVITVNASGNIYIQETAIAQDQLVPRLEAITRNKPDLKIYVRGDRAVAYGRIMEVMGLVSAAGYSKVALLAELPQQQSSERRRR